MKHILKFETPDDWKPLEPACWNGCPFACLTKLGEECQAMKAYHSDGLMICPVVRYGGILGKYEGIELYTDKGRAEFDFGKHIKPGTYTVYVLQDGTFEIKANGK